ncbi:hypothetical protein HDIA_1793 [Hartmannibacter diazotrophicus]|uniref:DUF3253 domain-containing protein n=1 Tax=Hartmannibacter diazotrophicus TaxID=1482074 RepID=A0A2C9D4V3_9HYPH|nr:DUF3253 domain-containing protein [Hartmannibacter diazotrophicus]SON55334.1 hypothetical protein HDIA_1793 [Hartmannibacter diazotrophicus]
MSDAPHVSDGAIAEAILDLMTATGRSISPDDVARRLAGSDSAKWRLLAGRIRAQAVVLAKSGQIVILRKGKPVDPSGFKGVYRLDLPSRHPT